MIPKVLVRGDLKKLLKTTKDFLKKSCKLKQNELNYWKKVILTVRRCTAAAVAESLRQ